MLNTHGSAIPRARRSALLATALAAALVGSAPAGAQQDADVTAAGVWTGVTGDVRIAPRALITFTSEARRADGVALPRQFFVLAGVLADVGRGIRIGGGYSGWLTSPNDAFGPAASTSERRLWQQLSGSHRMLGAAWNHRLRYEQRWTAPTEGGSDREWAYGARARHQIRVVVPVDGRAPNATRLYVMPNVELFATTSNRRGVLIEQTRFGTALGLGVASRLNLEAGYLRQGFVRAGSRQEIHHVLQLTARVSAVARVN